jgi:hypothetical protein
VQTLDKGDDDGQYGAGFVVADGRWNPGPAGREAPQTQGVAVNQRSAGLARGAPRLPASPALTAGEKDSMPRDNQMTDRNHWMSSARATGLRNVLVEGLILLAFVALSSSLLGR